MPVGGEDAQEVAPPGWIQRPQLARRRPGRRPGQPDVRAQRRDQRQRIARTPQLGDRRERAVRVERPDHGDHVGCAPVRASVRGAFRAVRKGGRRHGVVTGLVCDPPAPGAEAPLPQNERHRLGHLLRGEPQAALERQVGHDEPLRRLVAPVERPLAERRGQGADPGSGRRRRPSGGRGGRRCDPHGIGAHRHRPREPADGDRADDRTLDPGEGPAQRVNRPQRAGAEGDVRRPGRHANGAHH
jgi:hypothetical protein